jgi:hypothetical protein
LEAYEQRGSLANCRPASELDSDPRGYNVSVAFYNLSVTI